MQPWLQGGAAHLLVLTLAGRSALLALRRRYFPPRIQLPPKPAWNVMIWGTAALLYFWRAAVSEHLPRFYRIVADLASGRSGFVYLTC